ncbi:NADH dehydrogenase [ubiquinone] 1 beta subcomplex subunit 5, mitochondrial isoform X2 [Atheta coriaria]|uniref:NADH dehydrogenase [ubiquinone] 1 beta subcomplex subunit 5, mitochondrial isoform X2 n=1 Tax=Dalotia coriaria TaxID=877792 RepID=UPI0031F3FEAF
MAIWSALRALAARSSVNAGVTVAKRAMSGHDRTFAIEPSRWQWNRFKDYFHYYCMLGLIPVGAVITLTNVFVGPATLSEIPEGYTPKYWEYYRHPISRWIARYILKNPQEDYEKYLHMIFEEQERRLIRKLEVEIKEKMKERQDYQAYYYRPITAKYHRATRDTAEYLDTVRGE